MSLALATRNFASYAPALACALRQGAATTSTRQMSVKGSSAFDAKERALEAQYFNKEDERNLRKLLSKMKTQADTSDTHAAAGVAVAEESALKEIVTKYNVSDADFQALLDWKHHHY